jgi:dTDP-L-rhamnose 4-epimerase
LIAEGHDVTIIDALRPPIHRDGTPLYLPEAATFHHGDVRDRALMAQLIEKADVIYHFAAYQDYLTDFSTFFDISATSTALIYELLVEQNRRPERVVIASSQAAMGEGLYACPGNGTRTPDIRIEEQLRQGHWDIEYADCEVPLEVRPTPESVANLQNPYAMSKYGQEMIGLTLGRRYNILTVLLRYSIVQGPRQSVYNAYSGACRIFCLCHKLGVTPLVYEDG